jgi:hypothetical protein
MMDPAATNAALARHYRLAKHMGWAQFAFIMLGIVGAIRRDWIVFAYVPSIACAVLGQVAMTKAKRLLQAQLAELRELRDETGRRLGVEL